MDPRPGTSRQSTPVSNPSSNHSRQASLDLPGTSRNGSISSLGRVPSRQPSLADLRQISRPVSYESLSSRLANTAGSVCE